MKRRRQGLLKRLAAVLKRLAALLEPIQADGIRLRKRYRKVREQLLVLMSNREVPTTNDVSEQALRLSTIFRKVMNGFRGAGCTEACGLWCRRATGKGSRPRPRFARRWKEVAPRRRPRPRLPNDRHSRYRADIDLGVWMSNYSFRIGRLRRR